MAVPKKKTSVSRKGKRHAGQHHRLVAGNTDRCSNCEAVTIRHHVCSACGFYKGQQVYEIKVKAAAEEASSEETPSQE